MSQSPEKPTRLIRLRYLLFGVLGLALLIAVPLILWRYLGNPFNRLPTSVDTVREYIDRRYVPADVAVGLLSLVLWAVWLQYVWALLWEIVVVGPTAARGEIARSAPFAPKVIQSLASTVASGLLAASVVVGSPSLATLGSQLVSTPAALATSTLQEHSAASAGPTMTGVTTYVMPDGETLWSLADRDDGLVRKILDLNEHQIRSAVDVRPGMELIIPVGLVEEPAADIPVTARPESSQVDANHVVIEDDNLWNIAAERLDANSDQPVTNRSIAEGVEQIVDGNRDVIEDPDLIYPGEVIELPSGLRVANGNGGRAVDASDDIHADVGAGTDDGFGSESDDPANIDEIAAVRNNEVDSRDPAVTSARSEPADGGNDPWTDVADATEIFDGLRIDGIQAAADATAEETALAEETAQNQGTVEPPASAQDENNDEVSDAVTLVASPAVVGRVGVGFLSIGAGLGLFVRRLRQRRSARYGVGQTTADLSTAGEMAVADELSRSADPQFISWAAAQLNELRPLLASGPAPVAIRLAADSASDEADCGLEIVWRGDPPAPPPRWRAGDERTWFLAYDETAGSVDDPGVAALPGLVPLGESIEHGGLVLLNAAAYGTIAVAGDPAQTDDVMRSILLQLATTELLSSVVVTIVGSSRPVVFAKFDNIAVAGEEAALRRAEVVAAQHDSAASMAAPTAAATPVDIELFVVSALAAQLDSWLELAKPGSGVVVLLRGAVKSSRLGASLNIEPDGAVAVDPLGSRLRFADVSPPEIAALGRLVDQITAEPNHQASIVRSAAEVVSDHPLPTPDSTPSTAEHLQIQVLGRMRCETLPALAGRALSLVTFLALRPDRQATKAEIIESVWGGRQITDRQFMRVATIVRSHLGPARFPHQSSPDDPLRLVDVDTDLGHLQHLVARAVDDEQPADLLSEAATLITGPPFEGAGSWWAQQSGLVDHSEELIESLTVQAVAALAAAGRGHDARVAATNGLKALPANEPIYRAYLSAVAQSGQHDAIEPVVDHLMDSRSFLDPAAEPALSPETTSLVDHLRATASAPSIIGRRGLRS